jgi:phage tail sheath gpL-like
MTTISKPFVDISILPAQLTISTLPQRVLFVGQKTSVGTAPSGILVESIQNDNEQINSLFGENSMLAPMLRAAKRINEQVRFDVIPLDDNGSGVAATGVFTVTGTATEAGELTFKVGSARNGSYTISIADTDTATIVGDAIAAAINADTKAPVTAANVAGVVTLTAVNAGNEANTLSLEFVGEVAGVSVAITAFTGGSNNPSTTNLFDVVDGQRYQTVVIPQSYDYTLATDFLDPRFNNPGKPLDGVAIIGKTDTFANLVSGATPLNSNSVVTLGNKITSTVSKEGGSLFEIDTVVAAQFAAIRSLRLLEDANISRYVTSSRGASDNFGGPAIASLPYFNTPFFDLPLTPVGQGFSDSEIKQLKDAGVSVIGNNTVGNTVISGEIVTSYKTDSAGNPDPTFKFLNAVDTSVTAREVFFNNAKVRFGQTRLTSGDLQPNRNMANEESIKGFFISIYDLLSKEDFVLTQSGSDALNFFKDNLTVTLDLVQGQAKVSMVTPIVTQLRELLATMQIAFSTNS